MPIRNGRVCPSGCVRRLLCLVVVVWERAEAWRRVVDPLRDCSDLFSMLTRLTSREVVVFVSVHLTYLRLFCWIIHSRVGLKGQLRCFKISLVEGRGRGQEVWLLF